jgi:hypothetical protein
MQMALFAVLIDALHPALEHGIEALDGIGGDELVAFASHVFVLGVVDGVVAGELGADLWIPSGLIGHDLRFARDVGENDGLKLGDGGSGDMEGTGFAAALDQGQRDIPVAAAATLDVLSLGRALNAAGTVRNSVYGLSG